MRIFYSPYELKPRTSLSSRASADARPGALLKIEHEDLGFGYADLFPWPELGDEPLADQLAMLQSGLFTALSRNSFVFTRVDARARYEGKSLWEGLQIPESHALVSDPSILLSDLAIDAILTQGFKRIKIKLRRDAKSEAQFVHALAKELSGKALLRLDFNSCLSSEAWTEFCQELSPQALKAIDFIEDPIEWTAAQGFGTPPKPISLAVDREADSVERSELCPEVLVIKPAIAQVSSILDKAKLWKKRIVFTSYLDHPLGQLWAAWSASKAAQETKVEICGLLSQNAYEPHAFQSLLKTNGPELTPPPGPGIGWKDELETLCSWKELL